jgi:hypothetical protein
MYIRKSDGTEEEFHGEKVARALERAQVSATDQASIVHEVERLMRPGTTTAQVHERVLHALEANNPLGAARYNLKHAMLRLGPTGFPFEQYFARLMQAYGWQTQVGAHVLGKCVTHEVDVYATRGQEVRAVEAKYHNTSGGRTDVKAALYVHARHLDLQARDSRTVGMLVTNTSFTRDAIAYGECVSMRMKGWNYPEGLGIAHYIEKLGLYPVTVFARMPTQALNTLMKRGLVLVSDLCGVEQREARAMGFRSQEELQTYQDLAHQLCVTVEASSVASPEQA